MGGFRDIPITRKLTLTHMLTSTLALALACAALFTYEYITLHREIRSDLETQADIVGSNSTSALLFRDQRTAENTLAALSAEPQILAACIYDQKNAVFAVYLRNSAAAGLIPPQPRPQGFYFDDQHLALFRPILSDNERVGVIHIRANLEAIDTHLRSYAAWRRWCWWPRAWPPSCCPRGSNG